MTHDFDAVIVGAGPNGLAAGITLARAGCRVLILEARKTVGGGMRSEELTLPGFTHDICSAVHALGLASPFMRSVPLAEHGVTWLHPDAPLAHPLDNGTAVVIEQNLEQTCIELGADAHAYRWLMSPLVKHWKEIFDDLLAPLHIPKHPIEFARFGIGALLPAMALAKTVFRNESTRAAFAGIAAHSILPLDWLATSGFALTLGTLAHAVGWPVAQGGTQRLADALASYFRSIGGVIETNHPVQSLDQLPSARATLLDITPQQFTRLAGNKLPASYRRKLENFRYGPGVFKIDFALDAPVPWLSENVARAGTVHVGGTLDEIAHAEQAVWRGEHPERPFVLLSQPTLFDPTRAPAGKHVVWAYCHVPNGSTVDMTARIETQIERFAPGFRERILAKATRNAVEMAQYNPNYVGGDINGGVQDLRQHFTRPLAQRVPYATPLKNVFLCSSSTPPGGGVHGMCGFHAAQAALSALGQ